MNNTPVKFDTWDWILLMWLIVFLYLNMTGCRPESPDELVLYDGPCPEEGMVVLPVQPEYLEVSGLVCADGEPLYCQEAVVYYDDLPASEATILCYPQGDVLVWAVVLDG